ncbi:MAG: hypothetical protein ABSH48_00740 [Verrucomicrobiota bacterium]
MKSQQQRSGCLVAILLVLAGCSPKTADHSPSSEAQAPAGPARFTIIPNDLAGIAEVTANPGHGTNAGYVVNLQFTDDKAAEFREFTRAHINQRVQLIIGHKVVAEPLISAEITNGLADLSFASIQEARTIIETLGKPNAVPGAGKSGELAHQTNAVPVNP